MILLNRVVPDENMNRWYLVAVQPTLFHDIITIVAWGRRDSEFQQWRLIPFEDQDQAIKLAARIVDR